MARSARKAASSGKNVTLRRWPAAVPELWKIDRITADPKNTRRHDDGQIEAIRASIREFGVTFPALVRENGMLIAGEGRVTAAKAEGLTEFPVVIARGWSEAQCRAYSIADNRLTDLSSFDADALKSELEALKTDGFTLELTGFTGGELDAALAGAVTRQQRLGNLADRFGVPPFSVLNAREGWWQDRKRAWIALGIRSELGRGENLASMGGAIERREAIKANATPGGSKMPAANYSKTKARGDGRGRPVS